MRPIKFRAWHVENKTMVNFDNKKVIKDQYQMAHLCELISGTHPDGELMQFTGLQDKNGVDIYEGDILGETRLLHNGPCYCSVEVKYVAPSFKVRDLPLCSYMGIEWEVIGNKFESPELLEQ